MRSTNSLQDRIEKTIGLKKLDVLQSARNGVCMRFVLSLLTLCALSSVPLRASDIFDITLTGSLSGNGTFTTDGICSICFLDTGLLSVIVNIGSDDSGMNAFDTSDDAPAAAFDRPLQLFLYEGTNSETGDTLSMSGGTWRRLLQGTLVDSGTYFVTPVPEPSSLFLLMPIVAIVGLRWSHQRHRV